MTMRSYRYFICPAGHQGTEKTSENDQPYSTPWESITTQGLVNAGEDSMGYKAYVCEVCKKPMVPCSA